MSRARAELVDRVVNAVTAVDGVAGIHAGGPGSAATYLPGRTVSGVRLDQDSGQINVIVEFRGDADLIDIADRARQAASDAAGFPIHVVVSDITVPETAHHQKEITA